jgi:predicted transposase YdaD
MKLFYLSLFSAENCLYWQKYLIFERYYLPLALMMNVYLYRERIKSVKPMFIFTVNELNQQNRRC